MTTPRIKGKALVGRVLRLPMALSNDVAKLAHHDCVSMNAWMTNVIRHAVKAQKAVIAAEKPAD